jgi:tRNA A-37 threonylcarbamoyl transferase component Bud32
MKFLALEKEVEGVNWDLQKHILEKEAKHVYNLYEQGIIREIYFSESKNAVIILECVNITEAKNVLQSLPLVGNKLIEFDVMELLPYTGYSRLFKD